MLEATCPPPPQIMSVTATDQAASSLASAALVNQSHAPAQTQKRTLHSAPWIATWPNSSQVPKDDTEQHL